MLVKDESIYNPQVHCIMAIRYRKRGKSKIERIRGILHLMPVYDQKGKFALFSHFISVTSRIMHLTLAILSLFFLFSVSHCAISLTLNPAFPSLTPSFSGLVDMKTINEEEPWVYVVGRQGEIHVFENNQAESESFLFLNLTTIENFSHEGECGLLGMALHPSFVDNGQFFVNYCVQVGESEYQHVLSHFVADNFTGELVVFKFFRSFMVLGVVDLSTEVRDFWFFFFLFTRLGGGFGSR